MKAANLPLDFAAAYGNVVDLWEWKTVEDLYASMDNHHLAEQMIPAIAEHRHLNLAIFGSLDEVRDEVPEGEGRTEEVIEMERNRLRGLCADLHGDGVRVHFLSRNYESSMRWILSYTKNTLLGGDVCTHLPRPDILQQALVSMLPGVGPKTSSPILDYYRLELRPHRIDAPPLSEVTTDSAKGPRRFGEKKAKKVYDALMWPR